MLLIFSQSIPSIRFHWRLSIDTLWVMCLYEWPQTLHSCEWSLYEWQTTCERKPGLGLVLALVSMWTYPKTDLFFKSDRAQLFVVESISSCAVFNHCRQLQRWVVKSAASSSVIISLQCCVDYCNGMLTYVHTDRKADSETSRRTERHTDGHHKWWLGDVTVTTLGLMINKSWVNSWSSCYQVVTTRMGDSLQTSKPSPCITNHQGQLSLSSLWSR